MDGHQPFLLLFLHEPVRGWRLGLVSVADLISPLQCVCVCVWEMEASLREKEGS